MTFEEINIGDKEIDKIMHSFSNNKNRIRLHRGDNAFCNECGEILYICKECGFRCCKNKKCNKFLRCSKYKKEDTTEIFQYGMKYRKY